MWSGYGFRGRTRGIAFPLRILEVNTGCFFFLGYLDIEDIEGYLLLFLLLYDTLRNLFLLLFAALILFFLLRLVVKYLLNWFRPGEWNFVLLFPFTNLFLSDDNDELGQTSSFTDCVNPYSIEFLLPMFGKELICLGVVFWVVEKGVLVG